MHFSLYSEIFAIQRNFRYTAKFSLYSEIFAIQRNFRYIAKITMHSEIPAPVFLMFLIQNDLVFINYHIVPIVILYFWYFFHFTHLGWLYKPPYKFVTLTLIFQYAAAFVSSFLSSLSSFSPFLGCQTPSKDDNLEDEWLKPLPS